jgi:hypothetical protein
MKVIRYFSFLGISNNAAYICEMWHTGKISSIYNTDQTRIFIDLEIVKPEYEHPFIN